MISKSRLILYVFECGSSEAEALRALPSLTEGEATEVQGLFVEDEDLLGAANLPVVAEVSINSLEVASFDPDRIARELVDQAQQARLIFERSANRLKLRHSFKISRGRTVDTLLEAAASAELVVVCRPLRAAGLRARQGSQFQQLVAQHAKILFVNEPWTSGTSVVAVCDGTSDRCGKTLQSAETLAASEALKFVVATTGDAEQTFDWPCDEQVQLTNLTEAAIIDLCQQHDARLLVMRPIEGVDGQKLLLGLLDRLSCSLLWLG